LIHRIPDSLSFQTAEVLTSDIGFGYCDSAESRAELSGEIRDVAIINSDNLNEKYIFSLPGEDLEHGSLIRWMDNYWLVTERDANTTIYTRAKMIQCNHLLRWVTNDDRICEQWCIIEDGTKYLTGELEDRQFIVTRGDSRISMTIARNHETVKFNRENRFLIDDPQSPLKLAYQLTKPLKLGWSYNSLGAYKFVLQEVTSTKNDDMVHGIADYYKHFPIVEGADPGEGTDHNGRRGWL
jgi:hypothetical protein